MYVVNKDFAGLTEGTLLDEENVPNEFTKGLIADGFIRLATKADEKADQKTAVKTSVSVAGDANAGVVLEPVVKPIPEPTDAGLEFKDAGQADGEQVEKEVLMKPQTDPDPVPVEQQPEPKKVVGRKRN